jgi:CelD/BcsL family acetyltransferase involved in cellulose biosynthesis
MNIQVVRDFHAFSQLRREWNDLLSRSSADTVFLTWEWLSSWWKCYAGAKDVLHIIVIRDSAGELIGILPLHRRLQPWLPLKPIQTLRFIGDGSWDSDYLDAILVQGREKDILESVWKWLRGQRSWSVLELTGIPESSATLQWLDRTEGAHEIVARKENIPCLVIDLPHSWEDYLASLKPRFRTKIRSTLREITAGHEVRFRTVDTEVELTSGLQSLYELHGRRWALKGTEGVFRNSAKRRFYECFTPLFLEQGWLAFDFLELNGAAAACQICFRYRGTQFLLQEGFDPEFADESVGIALRAMTLKKAIEDGIRQYDFLAGLGRHKTQWQTRTKLCQKISLGPRTIQNTAYLKVPVLMDALRERIKMLLPAKVLEIRRSLTTG